SSDRTMRARRSAASIYDRPVSRFRVIVADDHPLFREGVVRAVRAWPELELVAEVSNGREALARIRELSPDVACVDLRLPEIDGIGIAHAVSRDRLATRVLLLSAFADDELVYRALEAGATGYLTKDATQEEIARAIHGVASGHTQLAPELAAGLANQIRARSHGDTPILTERERQVLELLCEGLSAPQIAARLFLGTTTVKSHLGRLYEKLGVSDRAAAVAEAMRRGIVE
ncbi:MAG: two-component system, NarL family, nitrate/nitrite response regulator NarL, partial [Gaiellales bacterium]|nr:two-component system, NarL family, nitrate/nitrite response regulator NarL [Gaiellales bacterium]